MLQTYSVLFNFKIYYYFYLMMVWLRISLLIQFLSKKKKIYIYLLDHELFLIPLFLSVPELPFCGKYLSCAFYFV
jgi:hypothetical protein